MSRRSRALKSAGRRTDHPGVSIAAAAKAPRADGFTLVEVVVAMTLFAVLSSAVLSVLVATVRTSSDGGSRLVAADLASRELEITRDIFTSLSRGPTRITTGQVRNPDQLVGQTAGAPLVVDGVPYTVVRTAQWRNIDSAAASTCDEGGTLEFAYLRVRVDVSWPGLGDRPPVSMSAQMTPPKGTYDQSLAVGHIGLKVVDRLGEGRAGVRVVARTGATRRTTTTGDDGCALIEQVAPGTWTVTVDTAGFVTPQGEPTGTLTAAVQSGRLWTGSMVYDEAARLDVVICPPADHVLPPSLHATTSASQIPVTLANSGLLPGGSKPFRGAGTREIRRCPTAADPARQASAEVRAITSLWPYAAGYQLWSGGCVENDPQRTGQSRELPVASDPGQQTTATIVLGGVTVTGAPAGTALVATQVTTNADGTVGTTDSACSDGARIDLGTGDAAGRLATSLPFGRWRITPAAGTGGVEVAVVKGAETVVAAL